MPRLNTSNTFMRVSLALVLSLCSLSALSEGVKHITFLQKIRPDKDVFLVKPLFVTRLCIRKVSPLLAVIRGDGKGQTIDITYFKTADNCDILESSLMFDVQSSFHRGTHALINWIKKPGRAPKVENDDGMNPKGFTWVDDSDPDNIKVWVGSDGASQ